MLSRARAAIAARSIALAVSIVATRALAAEPSLAAEDRGAARDEFNEAKRAFDKGDYRRAAETFESAYRRAPHHSSLWNAARAWERASELARAANLYAHFLREAPPNAPDRDSATSSLHALSAKLARLEIHAPGLDHVRVDERDVDSDIVYVTPGAHVIEARAGEQLVRQSQHADPGAVISVALVAPPQTALPPPAPREIAVEPSRGWSPAIVIVGGAVTAALAGVTIWSGLDTKSQRDTFDAARTQENLDAGRSKQTRTNVLIGVTAAAGAFTTVAAIWLVSWGGKRESEGARVGIGPGMLTVKGTF